MKIRDEYTCPLEIVHDFVRGKWKPIIIFQLRDGPCSFSVLRRGISGISQKMLLEQLSELREFGIVDKITGDGYPLKADYFLTSRGMKLLEAVEIMQEVGKEYIRESSSGKSDIQPH